MEEITFPVRVMRALGAGTLVVSSAVGGMHPQLASGDLVVITDHINLMGDNPLIGPNDDELGPRFPDMSDPYAKELVELAGPMSTTFHRAFDMSADPFAALEDLVALGVDMVLTSGQRPSAMHGIELLARLVERADDRLIVMPVVGIVSGTGGSSPGNTTPVTAIVPSPLGTVFRIAVMPS